MPDVPVVAQVVLDCEDVRVLADFYRELLALEYRPSDVTPVPDEDWLVLRNPGGIQLAFQKVPSLPRSTWPTDVVAQQLHLDLTVPDKDALVRQRDRAVELGAQVLLDRFDDETEPLYVFADPAGHPFCIFVG